MKKKSTISVCMIVKNEEHMLEKCLDSIKDIADQIVIVDTGSQDNTINIAKKYNTDIFHFQWTNNFSNARNESIKHATGDWILWLDADERLTNNSKNLLYSIVNKKIKYPTIYKVNIRNIQNKKNNFYISDAHRLFTNHKGIIFSGRIHEQVSPSLKKINGIERNCDIEIIHYGYNLDEDSARKKNARNRNLLETMVHEKPNYGYGYYTLGQNYGLTEENDKALKCYRKAFDLNQFNSEMTASLLATMSEVLFKLNKLEEAELNLKKSIKIEPIQCGSYYFLYKISDKKNDISMTITWLNKLLDMTKIINKSGKKISTDVIIDEEIILQTLAKKHVENQDYEKAKEIYIKLLNYREDNILAIRGLMNYYLDNNNFEHGLSYFDKLKIHLSVKDIDYLNTISTKLIKNHQFIFAIKVYEFILSKSPNNEFALKRTVGLLAKIGKVKEAEELLLTYQNSIKRK